MAETRNFEIQDGEDVDVLRRHGGRIACVIMTRLKLDNFILLHGSINEILLEFS